MEGGGPGSWKSSGGWEGETWDHPTSSALRKNGLIFENDTQVGTGISPEFRLPTPCILRHPFPGV